MKLKTLLFLIIFLKLGFSINTFILSKSNSENENEKFNKINEKNLLNSKNNENGLRVFLLPHSHCDAGWLYTFDEYYFGTVQYIISGIIQELNQDDKKKFNWVEIGFFNKWYNLQNDQIKNIVKKLIKNKQLEFITGGWVQNDEATANIDDILEQMTQGHMWLKETLNYTVDYAWQIDPFGYSSLTPTLFSKMGIKGLVINRVSYNVRNYMKENKEMEFLWKGSETLDKDSELLVSTLDIHYSYPEMIDPNNDYSLKERVNKFIKYLKQLSKTRNSNTLLIPLGDDFRYYNAKKEFSISKEWIDYLNERKDQFNIIEIKYSTLSEYFEQLKIDVLKNNLKLNQFNKDFFPYATASDEYWTGYFTTRPSLKRQIRDVSNIIRVSDSMFSLINLENNITMSNEIYSILNENRNVISLAQHHDTVTGTSRSYVLFDYFLKLEKTRLNSYNIISNTYNLINYNTNFNFNNNSNNLEPLEYKSIINIDELKDNEIFSIVYFNSLGWSVKQHLSIKIKSNNLKNLENLKLYDSKNQIKDIEILSSNYNLKCTEELNQNYILITILEIPPLGYSTFYLKLSNDKEKNKITKGKLIDISKKLIFKSKEMEYEFSNHGYLRSIKNIKTNKVIPMHQSFYQYKSKNSGPYIFNAGVLDHFLRKPDYLLLFEGSLVNQLSMVYGSQDCNSTSIVNQRIYTNPNLNESLLITEKFLETSYSFIGKMNRERVIRYKVKSFSNDNNEFYTDNGLETRKRIHHQGSTTSNYYPTLHYVNIKDKLKNEQYTIYVDRSVGVTYPSKGEIEIMLHRTTDKDDWKGIRWPSKDTSRIDGKLYLNFDTIENQKENEKYFSLQLEHQPIYMVKKIGNFKQYQSKFIQIYSPLLSYELPPNIHLQSLKTYSNNRIGLRLLKINDMMENNNIAKFKDQKESLLNLNQYFNFSFNNNLVETGLSFLNESSNNSNYIFLDSIKNNIKIDPNFPIKSGESEYLFKKSQINQYKNNSLININPLEIKSFILKLNQLNTNTDKIKKNNYFSIYNNDIINNINNSLINNNNTIYYFYDFSIIPFEKTFFHYDDIGRYKDNTIRNRIIISAIIIVPTILIVIVFSSIENFDTCKVCNDFADIVFHNGKEYNERIGIVEHFKEKCTSLDDGNADICLGMIGTLDRAMGTNNLPKDPRILCSSFGFCQ